MTIHIKIRKITAVLCVLAISFSFFSILAPSAIAEGVAEKIDEGLLVRMSTTALNERIPVTIWVSDIDSNGINAAAAQTVAKIKKKLCR